MLATWHFHIEISSKCTLRCPRCAQQEVPDGLVDTELSRSRPNWTGNGVSLTDVSDFINYCRSLNTNTVIEEVVFYCNFDHAVQKKQNLSL